MKVFIGTVVGTHGIKGEIRIISSFPYKKKAFLVGSEIQIGENNYTINSYRVHKNYDMITLKGLDDINQVLFLKTKKVYKERADLLLDISEVLDEDLKTFEILTNRGKAQFVEVFMASPKTKILKIKLDERLINVPFNGPFIKIDPGHKQIIIELIEGM